MDSTGSPDVATGEALSDLRRQCGLTQRQLATRAGLHVNSIKLLERRLIVPRESWHSLALVAEALRESGVNTPDHWLNWRRWGPKSKAEVQAASERMLRIRDQAPPPTGPLTCGAKTRKGTPCRCKPLKNGRCKYHGGMSTGPRTPEGRRRIAEAQRRRWSQSRPNQSGRRLPQMSPWSPSTKSPGR